MQLTVVNARGRLLNYKYREEWYFSKADDESASISGYRLQTHISSQFKIYKKRTFVTQWQPWSKSVGNMIHPRFNYYHEVKVREDSTVYGQYKKNGTYFTSKVMFKILATRRTRGLSKVVCTMLPMHDVTVIMRGGHFWFVFLRR